MISNPFYLPLTVIDEKLSLMSFHHSLPCAWLPFHFLSSHFSLTYFPSLNFCIHLSITCPFSASWTGAWSSIWARDFTSSNVLLVKFHMHKVCYVDSISLSQQNGIVSGLKRCRFWIRLRIVSFLHSSSHSLHYSLSLSLFDALNPLLFSLGSSSVVVTLSLYPFALFQALIFDSFEVCWWRPRFF